MGNFSEDELKGIGPQSLKSFTAGKKPEDVFKAIDESLASSQRLRKTDLGKLFSILLRDIKAVLLSATPISDEDLEKAFSEARVADRTASPAGTRPMETPEEYWTAFEAQHPSEKAALGNVRERFLQTFALKTPSERQKIFDFIKKSADCLSGEGLVKTVGGILDYNRKPSTPQGEKA